MYRHLAISLAALALGVLAAGCASQTSDDDSSSADPGSGQDALSTKPCEATDTTLFFHGLSGYGRELAKPGLCVPNVNNSGTNSFWSDSIAYANAPAAMIVGGYSAGRIPLVRRLEKGDGPEQTAVMLDPSYADGPRFDGKTGPDIVEAWLDKDPARHFFLVYLPTSVGWKEFKALADGPHGDQVKTCPVTGTHLGLPALVTSSLFVDPDAWFTARCH